MAFETRSIDEAGRRATWILPLRLEAVVADKMDEAWRAKGIENPMQFFRGATGHYLAHLGARDTAALFTKEGATGA